MAAIRYLVPYQVDVDAYDLTSLKKCGNTFFLRTQIATSGTPAYGSNLAGSSSTTTLLASFAARWQVLIAAVLSVKYKMRSYTMRGIAGKQYATPSRAILGFSVGTLQCTVTTSGNHGFTTGDQVRLFGITTPFSANGNFTITVTAANAFTIPLDIPPTAWTGDGYCQLAMGQWTYTYIDREFLADTSIGGVAGDALPIYCTGSVRRITTGTGRNWRSKFELSIVGEADNDFGKLNSTAITTWNAALAVFNGTFSNGGSDTTAGLSINMAVSKQIAMASMTPFTESASWCKAVQSMPVHTILGSELLRKPKVSG